MSLDTRHQDQIVAITQSLVQIASLSGDEKAAVERAAGWLRALGYQDVQIDERGNAHGVLRGAEPGPTVLYDSHLDTVAAQEAEAWRFGPFSGHIAEGRLYGRGAADMKGALAACMAGLAYAHRDGKLRGTAVVTATVGEEVIEGLAFQNLIALHRPDVVVICESTGLRLNIAGRGRAEVTLLAHGKSAHASTPHLGVNALKHMARLVNALDAMPAPFDPVLGPGVFEPTEVISTPYPSVSVIPWRCRARCDRRLLPREREADVLDPINAIIRQLAAGDPTFRAEASIDVGELACYTGLALHGPKFQPAWQYPAEAGHVRAAAAALRGAGQGAALGHYGFCTNGSYTAGVAGIPTLGYGPGGEDVAHTTDEYLELDQLFGAAEGYYALGGMGAG